MIKIAVLITCFNRRKKTIRCLNNLFKQKIHQNIRLTVYLTDDGSTDYTSIYVKKQFPEVKIFTGNGNLYWGRGTNLVFKEAAKKNFDYYLWLNDDTYLLKGALDDLLNAKNEIQSKTFISVGSTKNKYNKLTYGGQKNKGSKISPFKNKIIFPNKNYQIIDRFNGNIVLISREAQKKIGFINKDLVHISGDIEYGIRASILKIPIFLCPNFQGICENDKKRNLLKDYFRGKCLIKSYFIFTKKYGGIFWILHFLSALLHSLKIFKLK